MASTFDVKGTSLDSFKIGIGGPSLVRNGSDIKIDNSEIITEYTNSHPGYRSGLFYFFTPLVVSLSSGTTGLNASSITYTPFYIASTVTISKFCINVASAVASSAVTCGVYSHDTTTKLPSNLLGSASVSTATIGVKDLTISLTLNPGWYWFAITPSGVPNLTTLTTLFYGQNYINGSTSVPTATFSQGIRQSGFTYGALPSTALVSSLSSITVCVAFWYQVT
ncbi:MAG: hypothetical protein ACYTXT_33715 [Nostoc sp.]